MSNTLASGTNTNFPMLFVGGTYLKTVGNGGRLQNSSGFDHIFSSASNCGTPLNYETETGSYVASTGVIYDWVQVPSLTTSTVIYVCYGNSGISTYQGNTNATWDGTFAAVYHVPTAYNGSTCTGANSVPDSTSNANGAACGSSTQTSATAGKINEAIAFTGTSGLGSGLSAPTTATLGITSKLTLRVWVFATAYNTVHSFMMSKNCAAAPTNYCFKLSGLGVDGVNGKLGFFGGSSGWILGTTAVTLNTWHLVEVTIDETLGSNKLTYYIDGVTDGHGSPAYSGTMTTGSDDLALANSTGSGNNGLPGDTDEMRIQNVARASTWIATEYNSETQPCGSGSFCTVGSEVGGGTTRSRISVMQH